MIFQIVYQCQMLGKSFLLDKNPKIKEKKKKLSFCDIISTQSMGEQMAVERCWNINILTWSLRVTS